MIAYSAIKTKEGDVYIGNRHWHIFKSFGKDRKFINGVQGFLTDGHIFLDRKKAAKHAYKCGQVPKKYGILRSEHVWPIDPPEWELGLSWWR